MLEATINGCLYTTPLAIVTWKFTRLLLENGADVNATKDDSNPELEVVKLLLEKGANVRASTSTGSTPLHFSCCYALQVPVVQLLLDRGADVQAINGDRTTPLHLACLNENVEIARMLLLDRGANVETKTSKGITPLEMAYYEVKCPKLTRLLVQHMMALAGCAVIVETDVIYDVVALWF
ncbi:unnamed protein product [Cylindrotheca closterium]|uniref:Ankyrin repeat protein n=1 Tax=Cylindrotheca closterium TaxID=2856 RepID=A0AAD2CTB4_9STRA|nr:unnamed protein product [Cylindrotheca closterium]